MRQVDDQTRRIAGPAESSTSGRTELRKPGRTGNKQHTHVDILTLRLPSAPKGNLPTATAKLARSGIRQKLWSLRLIVKLGRLGSKATMEGEMLTEIVETSSVGDTAEAFLGGE